MNKYIITLLLLIGASQTFAQHTFFPTRGKIAYDKITFSKARMREMQQRMAESNPGGGMNGRFGGNVDNMPESTTEKYVLYFDENSTLMYQDSSQNSSSVNNSRTQWQGGGNNRGGAGGGNNRSGGAVRVGMSGGAGQGQNARPNQNSKISYQDIKNNSSEVQIQIDEKYILKDSLQNITWRFTNEYRTIAGFECRRVNGSTADSLYLVAFYTDEIPLTGGPALVSGLPGMILGLAIPEMHIQYWATQVEYTNNLVAKDWRDKKSKILSLDEFVKSLGRFFSRGRDTKSNKRQVLEQLIY